MPADGGRLAADGAAEASPPADGSDGAATVGVIIADPGNRRHLVDWLAERFDVVERGPSADDDLPADVDCWLVDAGGAAEARPVLARAKVDAAPTFLPVLFLADPDDDRPDGRLWREFDEVVTLPVGKAELQGRLEALLRTRRLSLALAEERERLDSFAGFLAHDLRNPLNVAQGFLTLARDEGDPAAFDAVERALARLQARVQDALLLAREGEQALDPTPCDLADVAGAAWASFREADAALEAESVDLLADAGALERLLENLFRNAVEHAGATVARPAGEAPSVTIRVGPTADGFYVEDDGPGVPPEQREAIFESRVSSKSGATGLGLAIVRRLARAHGWSVGCTEGTDGGARFEFGGVRSAED